VSPNIITAQQQQQQASLSRKLLLPPAASDKKQSKINWARRRIYCLLANLVAFCCHVELRCSSVR